MLILPFGPNKVEKWQDRNTRWNASRDDPKLLWEDGLTEMELANLNGLYRIWDAGKNHYRLVISSELIESYSSD